MADRLSVEDVREFLLQNKAFTEEFFAENATPAMIDSWFKRRSKANPVNEHVDITTRFSVDVQPEIREEEIIEDNVTHIKNAIDATTQRRNSEPFTATQNGKRAAFRLRDMRKKKALTQYKKQTMFSQTLDEDYDLGATQQIIYTKPSLRKTQSAPIGKNILAKLINSSVYLHSTPSHDLRYKIDLRSSSEDEFLKELIQDIMQDLKLNTLCYKIVVNVGIIIDAETASLYLIEKIDQKKVLKVLCKDLELHPNFDCKANDAKFEDRIQTLGQDVVSLVAETGKTMRAISSAEDATLPESMSSTSNHVQKEILCKPIKNPNGEVIGVISLGGKTGSVSLVEQDDGMLEKYLTFCGICITNARIFSLSKEEFDRNKALLELAHDIFEEQTSLTNIMDKTMRRAINLFSCKQCMILLIADQNHSNLISDEDGPGDFIQYILERQQMFMSLFPCFGERFSHIFKMTQSSEKPSDVKFSSILRSSMDIVNEDELGSDHIVNYVSMSGKAYNSSIVKSDNMVNGTSAESDTEQVLCIPIRNNQFLIIGVVKLSRKAGDPPFNEKDEQILEAFTIFCGLGTSNCILYDKVCRAKAHQKVAIEVISYHTAASQLEVDKLKLSPIPSAKILNLTDLKFDDFKLLDDQMLTAAIRMFTEFEFIKTYHIKYETLCRWLLTVKKNYRRVIYHNWRHAFNVAQAMFAVLTTGNMSEKLSSLECLALLVGCLCHDLDHRGTNNDFQTKSESPLGQLYGTSIMEHHHFNHAVAILNSEGNNIFQNLTPSEYSEIMKLLKHAILATDLAQYFKFRSTFMPLIENKEVDFKRKEDRNMLRGILMTACDLGGITKPWKIQKKVVHLVTSEFFHQGDIEREKLQVEPQAMMDRRHILELPKLQVHFFNTTGIPVYKTLSLLSPDLQPLVDDAILNRNRWEELSKEVAKGHINPELEPVLKPFTSQENQATYL